MGRGLEQLREQLAGQYDIERELGRGVSAIVYRAHDIRHDRLVALKVLRRDVANAVSVERFTREIRLAARLQHPHIVPVFDSGSVGGMLFFVMPFVAGDTLRVRLESGPLPVDLALRLAVEVSDAMAYAHERDVLHRDIKPENILLAGDHALVTDFGVARLMHRGPGDRVTTTGFVLGTPAYMSPEQASGETEVDGRSDQFSLGCVLYEMLAGEPPFTGDSARAVIARRFKGPPAPVTTRRAGVPLAVDRILARALAVTPEERFENAYELTEVLALAQAESTVQTPTRASHRIPEVPAAAAWQPDTKPASTEHARPIPARPGESRGPSRALLLRLLLACGALLLFAGLTSLARCASASAAAAPQPVAELSFVHARLPEAASTGEGSRHPAAARMARDPRARHAVLPAAQRGGPRGAAVARPGPARGEALRRVRRTGAG